jgi:DNA-binding response OmpR family regulator
MTKVLIVDDEQRYRDHMERCLTRDGHEVRVAGSGEAAIAIGRAFQPRILVVDWMLQDELHGLQVAETLEAEIADLRTILITGFPSQDIRQDARSLKVCEFLEKPFELVRLRHAVRAAEQAAPTPLEFSPIAVFQFGADGRVHLSNHRAQQLLDRLGTKEAHWHDLGVRSVEQMQAAERDWIFVTPPAAAPERWLMRARTGQDGVGSLAVLVREDQPELRAHPVVRMLLDLSAPESRSWPTAGRVLVVDDDRWVRHVVARQIESLGGVCHAAATAAAAERICEQDSGVFIAIIDHDLPGEDGLALVRALKAKRPALRIVGTSGIDRGREFAAVGADGFLLKPWSLEQLVALIR